MTVALRNDAGVGKQAHQGEIKRLVTTRTSPIPATKSPLNLSLVFARGETGGGIREGRTSRDRPDQDPPKSVTAHQGTVQAWLGL